VDKANSRAAIDDHLIRQRFGFVPDISTTPFNNAVRLRESSMSTSLVSTMPSNMAFHDLTPSHRVPKAAKSLLGLGSKFIVTPSKTTGSIEQTIRRFQRDFHLKVYFACECDEATELACAADFANQQRSKLYVKSKWNPTENDVPFWVTARLSKFFARVQRLFQQRRATSNLLPYQEEIMNSLLDDPTLLFPDTDKGLGPCAVEYSQYVEDCLVHLRNEECYQPLSEEEAESEVSQLTEKIELWLKKYKQILGKHAVGYIENHIKVNSNSPLGQFYILYKIHKGMKNGRWPTRPVCSDVTSITHGIGKWINEQLAPVQQAQKSYFKDSFALKEMLDNLVLPPNALLFTADATSMYTNIRTAPALQAVSSYLRTNYPNLSGNVEAIIDALHLVFENNLFKFGDTIWKQCSGTAMGTPPAPPWATIVFGITEDGFVPRWMITIPFYVRFIDDVLGVWLVHPITSTNDTNWENFQKDMNSLNGLEWECTTPSTSVNFMDLTITIKGGRLETSLFEKSQNLYLYIPPHSSHPKGVLTGLIFGQVLRVRRLCTHEADATAKLQQFFTRLTARGHHPNDLLPLFRRAEENAQNYLARNNDDQVRLRNRKLLQSQKQVFFHLQYHPEDPPTRDIQRLWQDYVAKPPGQKPVELMKNDAGDRVGFNKLVVAYSRPLNLRNRFSVRDIDGRGKPVSQCLAK
jgi:hypothetical protein